MIAAELCHEVKLNLKKVSSEAKQFTFIITKPFFTAFLKKKFHYYLKNTSTECFFSTIKVKSLSHVLDDFPMSFLCS